MRRARTICSMTTTCSGLALALALALVGGCATAGTGARSQAPEPQDAPVASVEISGTVEGNDLEPAKAPRGNPPRRPADLPRRPGTPSPPPKDLSALHGPCSEQGCPAGMQCLRYCGIAGCRPGSVFRSCEIPCKLDAQCPEGLGCGQVSDGPGRVCLGGDGSPRRVPPGAELE